MTAIRREAGTLRRATTLAAGQPKGLSQAEILGRVERAQSGQTKRAVEQASKSRPKLHFGRPDLQSASTGRRPMPRAEDMIQVDTILTFEIYDEEHEDVKVGVMDESGQVTRRKPDDDLVRQVKQMVNDAQICRRDMYRFISSAKKKGIFKDKNQVYNLEYGLRHRPTITPQCANKWASVCKKRANWEGLFVDL